MTRSAAFSLNSIYDLPALFIATMAISGEVHASTALHDPNLRRDLLECRILRRPAYVLAMALRNKLAGVCMTPHMNCFYSEFYS